jgi:hypothetical protein
MNGLRTDEEQYMVGDDDLEEDDDERREEDEEEDGAEEDGDERPKDADGDTDMVGDGADKQPPAAIMGTKPHHWSHSGLDSMATATTTTPAKPEHTPAAKSMLDKMESGSNSAAPPTAPAASSAATAAAAPKKRSGGGKAKRTGPRSFSLAPGEKELKVGAKLTADESKFVEFELKRLGEPLGNTPVVPMGVDQIKKLVTQAGDNAGRRFVTYVAQAGAPEGKFQYPCIWDTKSRQLRVLTSNEIARGMGISAPNRTAEWNALKASGNRDADGACKHPNEWLFFQHFSLDATKNVTFDAQGPAAAAAVVTPAAAPAAAASTAPAANGVKPKSAKKRKTAPGDDKKEPVAAPSDDKKDTAAPPPSKKAKADPLPSSSSSSSSSTSVSSSTPSAAVVPAETARFLQPMFAAAFRQASEAGEKAFREELARLLACLT